ncbi:MULTISPECIES: hypothetical protein [Bradyrhizobium]|uniref:hypothetical protein n=1 Tax=Bradyrhizobium TaxID=374 RepID=UPI00155E56EA|nr:MULTISPECIES: hypothetical protein [Bradyrhizobium]MDD1520781.1 hypothetical protein [Bradyrhizobium sp. WBAH30]MDD1545832.1 hypothetical protein [Bradyrhizobium sp. WBAH41]MDD1558907.1 hypothetical protein [Bradyrhizobium sp. WBAH23]MDD1566443.1 hypothetical protein [Bradyrhizobium sp. WBAH33]MDD1592036.1 hypothetical protein [Bradyrhizobium sp. WBAH42]
MKKLFGALSDGRTGFLGVLFTLITAATTRFNPAYVIQCVMQPWNLVPSQAGLLVRSGFIAFRMASLAGCWPRDLPHIYSAESSYLDV